MFNLKKITVLALFPLQFLCLTAAAQAQDVVQKKLLVTAYYSPLPDQTFYIKGSYDADVRLNGRGTNGADGTPVYIGMLAAPKNYPFGTRVKIPGLGVGEVHDRGGAILSGDNYDRIDVWMGHGEEGLARALNWGARTVEGEVYLSPDSIAPGLDFSWVSSQLPSSYVAKLQANTIKTTTPEVDLSASILDATKEAEKPESVTNPILEETKEVKDTVIIPQFKENEEIKRLNQNSLSIVAGLGDGSQGEAVKNLQRMLWDLNYYQGELTGTYDKKTAEAVFNLQKDQGVLQSESDKGAGYFGKKTQAALFSVLEQKIDMLAKYPKQAQAWVPAKILLPQVANLSPPKVIHERQQLNFSGLQLNKKVVQDLPLLTSTLSVGAKGDQVTELQKLLILHHYLAEGLATGYFGPKTSEAVLKFQLEKGIFTSSFDEGAGRVEEKTLEALNLL